MSLLSVFQRRMKEQQTDESILLDADSTADKSPTELAAIVKAQAALLVKQKDLLATQRELIQKQQSQIKVLEALVKDQKQKLAEVKPTKAAPAKAVAPVKPKEAPKAVAPKVKEAPKADNPTAQILKKLFGGKV